MIDPIQVMAGELRRFPERERTEFLLHAYLPLGIEQTRNDVPFDPNVPFAKLYEIPTVEVLADRLTMLTADLGMCPRYLIEGLFSQVIRWTQRLADPATTSKAIDLHLGVMESVKEDLAKPVSARRLERTDDELKAFLEKVESSASRVPMNRKSAEEFLDRLSALQARQFNEEFWSNYTAERLSQEG